MSPIDFKSWITLEQVWISLGLISFVYFIYIKASDDGYLKSNPIFWLFAMVVLITLLNLFL